MGLLGGVVLVRFCSGAFTAVTLKELQWVVVLVNYFFNHLCGYIFVCVRVLQCIDVYTWLLQLETVETIGWEGVLEPVN